MNNPTFQKVVNTTPALGIAGQRASLNPAIFLVGNPPAGDGGVSAGAFVWVDDGTVIDTGTTTPAGIVLATMDHPNFDLQNGATVTYPEGTPVTVMVKGDIFTTATTAATVGQGVYVSTTTGAITTATAGSTAVTGTVDTGFKVLTAGAIGDIIIISNWS